MSEIFSREFGTGPRRVLAMHCSLAHSGAWRGLAQAMEQEITLKGFDMYAHGRSGDWDQNQEFQTANVEAGLRLLEEEAAPVDVVGHSFGGTVALRMALARPDLVRSLCLIEPVLFAVARQDAPEAQAELEAKEAPFIDLYKAGDLENATRLFNRMWGTGQPKWPDLPPSAREAMKRGFDAVPHSFEALYDDCHGLLLPGALDKVAMPALLLSGAESQPVMPVINAGIARRLPQARTEVLTGAGHMLPITHAAATAEILRGFWARSDVNAA